MDGSQLCRSEEVLPPAELPPHFLQKTGIAPLQLMGAVNEEPRMSIRDIDVSRVVAKRELRLDATPHEAELKLPVAVCVGLPLQLFLPRNLSSRDGRNLGGIECSGSVSTPSHDDAMLAPLLRGLGVGVGSADQ